MAILQSRGKVSPGQRSCSDVLKVALAFAIIYVVWGSTYLAIRWAVATIPPLLAAGVRCFVSGAILLGWAWVRGYRPQRAHWVAGAAMGALFFLVSNGLLHWAEQRVPSGVAALAIATEPLFILILGSVARRRTINRSSAVGLAVGTLGVALLADLAGKDFGLMGLAAVLLAALSWSVGVVIQPLLPLPADVLVRTGLPLICAAPMLLLAAAFSGEFHRASMSAVSGSSAIALVYLIVFGSVLALTTYTWLLQRFPPALVATHTYANPVIAVLLGWLIASEPLNFRVVMACAATLSAIALIRRGEQATAVERLVSIPTECRESRPAPMSFSRQAGSTDEGRSFSRSDTCVGEPQ
jgi:drug/metabolite transporter (DMT)-like permease